MMLTNKQIQNTALFSLEHVPLPAVVCDENGFILGANSLFLDETHKQALEKDVRLTDLVVVDDNAQGAIELSDLVGKESQAHTARLGGQLYAMHVAFAEDKIGCFFSRQDSDECPTPFGEIVQDKTRGRVSNGLSNGQVSGQFRHPRSGIVQPETCRVAVSSRLSNGQVSGQTVPGGKTKSLTTEGRASLRAADVKMLEAFIRLSRDLNLTMRTEEIIELFVKTYQKLFPGRLLCIRLLDEETKMLKQVYANGRLRQDVRERLYLSERAANEFDLDGEDHPSAEVFEQSGVELIEEYKCVFVQGTSGFDIPLHDRSAFYGVLNFEYTVDCEPELRDRLIAIPLAQQMCTALRNAQLLAETIVLKDYLEKLLDQANAPVVVVDRDRLIKVVNQAFEHHTEYDREDILGEDLMTLLSESERVRILPALLSALRGDAKSSFEIKIPKAGGHGNAHIAFNTGVIRSAYGDLEGVILVGQDLSEIRALQNQIIHSEKLATLGQVAAGVAHELNNPLTSISVYASYLVAKCTEIDEADRAKMRRIVDAAGRIQAFTRDLVTYARPAGEEPVLIHIPSLIERALSFCEHLIDENKAQIEFKHTKEVQPVYGIQGQLEQVFVNLITNACHALPEVGGTISIAVSQSDDERLSIRVSDTGRGIAADQLGSIFEPFYTTKPEGQGTGLGLSIVKNILVNHHATIEVESALGKGTVFSLMMYSG